MSFIGKPSPAKLLQAATRGKAASVKKCIKAGVNVNSLDRSGTSALHMGAAGGHHKVVEALLNSGAEFTLRDCKGRTALHLAATGNHRVVTSLILDRAQNLPNASLFIDSPDSSGKSALYLAVEANARTAIRILVLRGASIEAECKGIPLLEVASEEVKAEILMSVEGTSLRSHLLLTPHPLANPPTQTCTHSHASLLWGRCGSHCKC